MSTQYTSTHTLTYTARTLPALPALSQSAPCLGCGSVTIGGRDVFGPGLTVSEPLDFPEAAKGDLRTPETDMHVCSGPLLRSWLPSCIQLSGTDQVPEVRCTRT